MKVMQVQEAWGTGNIHVSTRPDPTPGPLDVVVAMKAVSINPRDRIMCQGGYGKIGGTLPLIPLCDGAGEIVAMGSGVAGYAIGDLVCPAYSRTWLRGPYSKESSKGAHGGPLDGTAQDFMVIPANALVRAPRHMSPEQAATLPCAAVTSWNAIVAQGRVQPGDKVLLQGTGGISLFALQFAKMAGAEVFITSSNDNKLARARELGADHTINYRSVPDWHKAVLELTGGQGVDHVVDVGGASTLDKSTAAVRPNGTISMIGVLGGAQTPDFGLGRVVTRNLRLQGITVGSRDLFVDMAEAMELHEIIPVVDDRKFALQDLGAALDSMEEGRHFGKIVGTV